MLQFDFRYTYGPHRPAIYNPIAGFDRRRILQIAWDNYRDGQRWGCERISFGEALRRAWRYAREIRGLFLVQPISTITEAERAWISKESD